MLRLRDGDAEGGNETFFAYFQMLRLRETPKVNLLELLSNIGGIVGICLGIHIVSVFDLISDAIALLWFVFRGKLRVGDKGKA